MTTDDFLRLWDLNERWVPAEIKDAFIEVKEWEKIASVMFYISFLALVALLLLGKPLFSWWGLAWAISAFILIQGVRAHIGCSEALEVLHRGLRTREKMMKEIDKALKEAE